MKTIIITLVISMTTINTFCQTYFQGGIYNNTEWSLENSPYIITGDVVLFPDKILTIQPGVQVKFDGFYFLEIRGTLNAIGNENNRIVFTSNQTSPNNNDWQGTKIKNNQGASASFEFCDFSYASVANNVECCNVGGPIYFNSCSFSYNTTALSGYTGYDNYIDNCAFSNNTYCVTQADKIISNSTFIDNQYGLFETERINVSKSIFQNNEFALYGGRGLVDSCVIENNNIGVKPFFEGFELRNNQIVNNTIGVQLSSYNGNYPPVKNNQICNNSTYNVENLDDINKDITENCWCSSDSTIIEDKLYDGYENIYIGLLNYDIFEENCLTVIHRVIKVNLGTEISGINTDKIIIYPNPADEMIAFSGISEFKKVEIYDISGKLLMSETETPICVSTLQKGIYIVKITTLNGLIEIEKLVKN